MKGAAGSISYGLNWSHTVNPPGIVGDDCVLSETLDCCGDTIMLKRRNKRRDYLFLLLLACMVVSLGWLIRQQRLNRALIAAIKQYDTQVALTLLDQGADANSRDKPGLSLNDIWFLLWNRRKSVPEDYETALMVASQKGSPTILKLLLDHGADPNAHMMGGFTALMLADDAGGRGSCNCHRLLVERGANINARSRDGGTALMCAVAFRRMGCTRFLVEHGADVNAMDNTGQTALMCAVAGRGSTWRLVEFLLTHGAAVNIKTNTGATPLKWAKGKPQIISLLKRAGAKE